MALPPPPTNFVVPSPPPRVEEDEKNRVTNVPKKKILPQAWKGTVWTPSPVATSKTDVKSHSVNVGFERDDANSYVADAVFKNEKIESNKYAIEQHSGYSNNPVKSPVYPYAELQINSVHDLQSTDNINQVKSPKNENLVSPSKSPICGIIGLEHFSPDHKQISSGTGQNFANQNNIAMSLDRNIFVENHDSPGFHDYISPPNLNRRALKMMPRSDHSTDHLNRIKIFTDNGTTDSNPTPYNSDLNPVELNQNQFSLNGIEPHTIEFEQGLSNLSQVQFNANFNNLQIRSGQNQETINQNQFSSDWNHLNRDDAEVMNQISSGTLNHANLEVSEFGSKLNGTSQDYQNMHWNQSDVNQEQSNLNQEQFKWNHDQFSSKQVEFYSDASVSPNQLNNAFVLDPSETAQYDTKGEFSNDTREVNIIPKLDLGSANNAIPALWGSTVSPQFSSANHSEKVHRRRESMEMLDDFFTESPRKMEPTPRINSYRDNEEGSQQSAFSFRIYDELKSEKSGPGDFKLAPVSENHEVFNVQACSEHCHQRSVLIKKELELAIEYIRESSKQEKQKYNAIVEENNNLRYHLNIQTEAVRALQNHHNEHNEYPEMNADEKEKKNSVDHESPQKWIRTPNQEYYLGDADAATRIEQLVTLVLAQANELEEFEKYCNDVIEDLADVKRENVQKEKEIHSLKRQLLLAGITPNPESTKNRIISMQAYRASKSSLAPVTELSSNDTIDVENSNDTIDVENSNDPINAENSNLDFSSDPNRIQFYNPESYKTPKYSEVLNFNINSIPSEPNTGLDSISEI